MTAPRRQPIWKQLALGGTSVVPAVIVTHPLDIVKLRQQIQGYRTGGATTIGTFTGIARIAQEEGLLQLFNGISPAIVRAYTYSATRLGMYEPIRTGVSQLLGTDEPTFGVKICAALASGTLGKIFSIVTSALKSTVKIFIPLILLTLTSFFISFFLSISSSLLYPFNSLGISSIDIWIFPPSPLY